MGLLGLFCFAFNFLILFFMKYQKLPVVCLVAFLSLAGGGAGGADSKEVMISKIVGRDRATTAPPYAMGAHALVSKDNEVVINAWNGTLSLNAPTLVGGDAVISVPRDGGNLGASNALTGILNIDVVAFGTLTDGSASAKTKALMDDSPAGEWTAIGGGTADPTPVNDGTLARVGSGSLKIPFANAAVAGDGVKFTAFTAENWEAQESVGMWVYSSIPLAAGDVVLKTVDSTGDVAFDMPAVATSHRWTWVEFNISGLGGGTGDAVTNVKLALSTAGAARGAFNLNVDGAWKWDATEELALGVDLVDSPGAVRRVLAMTKANTGTHDAAALVEGTDYFIHRESGNDFLVCISNLSAKAAWALVFVK